MKKVILVVLYKCSFDDSQTLKSLLKSVEKLNKDTILIWDNSPSSQSEDKIRKLRNSFERFGIKLLYKNTPENLSLSNIYNNTIKQYNCYDYLVIFDQDSDFDDNFFKELHLAYSTNPEIKLFLPLISYKGNIISPSKKIFMKGFYLKNRIYGKHKARNFSAINSGMVIAYKYLIDKYSGYDERLKFYGTDDFFMMNYGLDNKYLYIINYMFDHDLTLSMNNESSEKLLISYHQMLESWKIIYSKYNKCLIQLYILIHSIKTALKYKDSRYIKWN